MLVWVAFPFSERIFTTQGQTQGPHLAGRFLAHILFFLLSFSFFLPSSSFLLVYFSLICIISYFLELNLWWKMMIKERLGVNSNMKRRVRRSDPNCVCVILDDHRFKLVPNFKKMLLRC